MSAVFEGKAAFEGERGLQAGAGFHRITISDDKRSRGSVGE